jgi:hypothetical protein
MTKARDLANASTALSAVSATELGYLDGVTSAVQTQMDAKAPSSTAVTLTGTQTLTNKTMTSPALTTPTISTATTNGDILYGTGSGALARLGIGSTDQVLKVTAGIPSWATPASGTTFVGCWAYGLNQTIANGATTYVSDLGYESFDSDAFHSTTTNNSRITIPTGKGGKYQVNATVSFDNGNANVGYCQMFVRLNGSGTHDVISGTQIHATTNIGATGNNNNSIIVATGILSLAAADYIELLVRSDQGSASSIRITPQLSVGYLGA